VGARNHQNGKVHCGVKPDERARNWAITDNDFGATYTSNHMRIGDDVRWRDKESAPIDDITTADTLYFNYSITGF
jgi:hypothetical protein